ncbi:hypothetical protein [Pseudomonas sp. UBA4617]|uniref:hypothetical protein n=1 Tax=Pseudomonas sp. UBA4617 TaxID=1947318 RepID=UPI0025F8DAB1|nr:hypothetical protein [Pseudomonas sp. UBA4617]
MNTSFRTLLRSQKLKSPTDRGFDLNKWAKAWENVANDDERHIYDAGITFNQLLGDIRSEIEKLYQDKFPGVNLSRMLELYCCVSNRDIAIASNAIKEGLFNGASIHSLLLDNNVAGNPLSGEEVTVGAVDGVQPAIRACLYKLNGSKEIAAGKKKIKPVDFIRHEAILSNLYSSYEQYFQALVWGDYSYSKEGNKISIQQQPSSKELALEVSNLRKSRFQIRHALSTAQTDATSLFHGKYNYIKIDFKKSGEANLIITPIEKAPLQLQAENASLFLSMHDAMESFPKELTSKNIGHLEFCLKEALEVLKQLSLISKQFAHKNTQYDIDIFSANQMLVYLAQVSRRGLIQAIARATKLSNSKTRQIIDFITFSGEPKQDLWSHPIIETRKGKLSFILGAASSPIMQRVLEHWLAECFSNDDIKEKGKTHEEAVCKSINTIIPSNKLISDYSPCISTTVTLNEKKEEIDLLVRIGSVILVGELKSIFTSDSPRSHFRAYEKLEFGANQAKRKANFIQSDLGSVFNQIHWSYDSTRDYKIIPIVISNNKTFSGFPINEVPVVDELILGNYLKQSTSPIISYYDPEKQKTVHTAVYRLYESFEQLQENLTKYLLLPPVIEGESENFTSENTQLPGTSSENEVIEFSRLVYSKLTTADSKLEQAKSFPIEKSSDHDEVVSSFHTVC